MGYPTEIQWTDATWNPIGGCSIKSPGCINCYAQLLAGTRLTGHPLYAGVTDTVKGKPVFNGKMTIAADDHDVWRWPLKWRGAKYPRMGAGMPSLIFVGDMADLFHEDRPTAHIDKVIRIAGACEDKGRSHILQLLTKRADVMADYILARAYWAWNARRIATERWPANNLWLGFSAERQPEFDERWSHMRALAEDGWTIFVSIEPMLAPVVLPPDFLAFGNQVQIIAGGESGTERRDTDQDWMRALRDQCLPAGVAYFTKQMTGKRKIPDDLMIRQFPAVLPPAVVETEPQMNLAV
jgi:protein gp37